MLLNYLSKFVFIFFTLFSLFSVKSQTTLVAGDLAIIGFNGDDPDQFAFVLLVDIESGTEITFTDSGVKSDDTFRGNEGAVKFTASSNYSAGSIITYTGPQSGLPSGDFTEANDGNVGNNDMNLSSSGDQIFAFQGTSNSPTFIFGFQTNSNTWQADATGSTNSALPSSLTNGVNAVAVGAGSGAGSEYDNSVYDESVISGTKSTILSAITNNTNWNGNNTRITFSFSTYTVASSSTTWTGGTDTDWATAGNWDNGVPTSSLDATIPDVTNAPIIGASTGASVKDLTINESDGLTILGGGSLIVNGTASGTITYTRTLGTNNYYLVASPVVGETYDDTWVSNNGIATGTGSNRAIATYVTLDDTWTYFQAGSSATFQDGQGYAIRRSSSGNVSFTGTMNTDDETETLTTTGNGFNLLGNPYPSYINSGSILSANSGSLDQQTIWLWDQSTASYDTKVTNDAFKIAPGQGFFVKSDGASGNVSILESYQSHQSDTFQGPIMASPEIYLTLTDDSNTRYTRIKYNENATTGFDNGYDGEMFGATSNAFAIYTHLVGNEQGQVGNSQGHGYAVQSLPKDNYENMIVPVGINATRGTTINIKATLNNFPEGVNVYLADKQENSVTLLETDTSYSTTLEEDHNGVGRFYIHTTPNALSSGEVMDSIPLSIYTSDSETLTIEGVATGTAYLQLYTMLGEELLRTSFEGTGVNRVLLPNHLNTGIYIVRIATATGVTSKKIMIN